MFLLVVVSFIALVASIISLIEAFVHHRRTYARVCELQNSILEAQRLLKQKGDLANEVAHEIKNPLTAILCSVETLELLVGPDLEEDHRKSLIYIKEYSEGLLRLVTTFIDINRAEVGKLVCRKENLEIVPLAESVVGLLSSIAHKKCIELGFNFSDRELVANVDPVFTKQILFNLIHNALKFTPANGEVLVSVCESEKNEVKIVVKDNGCGISTIRLKSIFDPYRSHGNAQQPNEGGVGLGLALTKTLVGLLDGNIEVESREGYGTTFTVTLPAALEAVRRSSRYKADAISPLKGCRFLVVDEDLSTRESVASLIEAWGGMVDKVSLAAEALDAVARGQYQAVLVDESLQGVDGFELTQIIKTNHTNDKAKIILTSRHKDANEAATEAGADVYLQKPFDGPKLLQALKTQFEAPDQ